MAPSSAFEVILEKPVNKALSKELGEPDGSIAVEATSSIAPKTSDLLKPELKELLQRRRALGAAAVWDSAAFKEEATKNSSEDIVLAGQVVQATPAYRSGWSQTPKFHDWGDKFKFVPRPREAKERPVKTETACASMPKDGKPRRRLQADILDKFKGLSVPDAPGTLPADGRTRPQEERLPSRADFFHGFADGRGCPQHEASYSASCISATSAGTVTSGVRRDEAADKDPFFQSSSVEAAAKDAADILEMLTKRKAQKKARAKQSCGAAAEHTASRNSVGHSQPGHNNSRLKLAPTAKSDESAETLRAKGKRGEKRAQRQTLQKQKLDQMLEFATNEKARLSALIEEARADGEQQEERIHQLLEQKATTERILAESRRQRDDLEVQVRVAMEQRDAAREEGHALAAERDSLESFLQHTQQENARLKDVVHEASLKKSELKDIVEQKASLEAEICQVQATSRELKEKADRVEYLEMVKEQGLEAIARLEQELLEGSGSRAELIAQKAELDMVLEEVIEQNKKLQVEIQWREYVEARMIHLQEESRALTEKVENSTKEQQQIEDTLAQVAERNCQLQSKLQEALAKTAQLQEANAIILDGMEPSARSADLAMEKNELLRELAQVEQASAAKRKHADAVELDKLALERELEEEEWWCPSPPAKDLHMEGFSPLADSTVVNAASQASWMDVAGKDATQRWLEEPDSSMVCSETCCHDDWYEPGAGARLLAEVTAELQLGSFSGPELAPCQRTDSGLAQLMRVDGREAQAMLLAAMAPAAPRSSTMPNTQELCAAGSDASDSMRCSEATAVPHLLAPSSPDACALPLDPGTLCKLGEDRFLQEQLLCRSPRRADAVAQGIAELRATAEVALAQMDALKHARAPFDCNGHEPAQAEDAVRGRPSTGPPANAPAHMAMRATPDALDLDAFALPHGSAVVRGIGGDRANKAPWCNSASSPATPRRASDTTCASTRGCSGSAVADIRCKRNLDLATRLDDVLKQNEELQMMIDKELGDKDMLPGFESHEASEGAPKSELDSLLDGWLRALDGKEDPEPMQAQEVDMQAEDIYGDDDEEDVQTYLDRVGRTYFTENAFVIWDPSGGTPMRAPRKRRGARGAGRRDSARTRALSDLHAVNEDEEEDSEVEDAALDAVKLIAPSGLGAAFVG